MLIDKKCDAEVSNMFNLELCSTTRDRTGQGYSAGCCKSIDGTMGLNGEARVSKGRPRVTYLISGSATSNQDASKSQASERSLPLVERWEYRWRLGLSPQDQKASDRTGAIRTNTTLIARQTSVPEEDFPDGSNRDSPVSSTRGRSRSLKSRPVKDSVSRRYEQTRGICRGPRYARFV